MLELENVQNNEHITGRNLNNNTKAALLSFDNMLGDGNISVNAGEYVKQFAEQYGCSNLGDRRTPTDLMFTLHSILILKLKENLAQHCGYNN